MAHNFTSCMDVWAAGRLACNNTDGLALIGIEAISFSTEEFRIGTLKNNTSSLKDEYILTNLSNLNIG